MFTVKRFIFFLFFCTTTHLAAYEYELAVCAVFKNEARFIKEWLEFYKLIGVQHFYLYDNNSTDNYKEILEPYIQAGNVDLSASYDSNVTCDAQRTSYNDCISKVRGKVKWLAILDIDEFLFPVQQSNLQDFLKNYEDYGAVCANWLMFGTSNIEAISDDQLLIESLIMRDQHAEPHIKSIIQPSKVELFDIHNATIFYPGFFQITAEKVQFSGDISPSLNMGQLRINHYWAKDKKFLYEVKIPRREELGWSKQTILEYANAMNTVEDLTIQRFVAPLKKILIQSKQ